MSRFRRDLNPIRAVNITGIKWWCVWRVGAPPKVQPIYVSATYKESLDYTAPMGVSPKVQPMFVSST